jgi:hypothetical protein
MLGKYSEVDILHRRKRQRLKPVTAKTELIHHLLQVRLQFAYIAKQQIHNFGFWCSIMSGQLWSSLLFIKVKSEIAKVKNRLK